MSSDLMIDADRAIELLREAVAERGEDYVYRNSGGDGCKYVHDGQPSCLVGLAMHKAGVPIEKLIEWDHSGPYGSSSADIATQGVATVEAQSILYVAQGQQDAGKTWGEALRVAIASNQSGG